MSKNSESLEKLRVFYQKYKLIIWPIASGVACLIIIIFVLVPQLAEYLGAKKQIVDLQKRSDSLEAKAEELEQIDDVSVKHNLQIAFTVLPASPDIPQVMTVIQDVINKSGLSLKNTNYSTSVSTFTKGDFELTISVLGSLSSVRNFLINLKEAPLILQVEAIKARFQREGSMVEVEIPIRAFYESNLNAIGALDQPVPKISDEEEQLMSSLAARVPFLPNNIEEMAGLSDAEQESSASSVPLGKIDPFN